MDEIIEKLNRKSPEKNIRSLAEPITARVSREKVSIKMPITPPELNYRSPQLSNRFYSSSPK